MEKFSLTAIASAILAFPMTVAHTVAEATGSDTLGAIAGGLTIVAGAVVGGVLASAATTAIGGVMGEVAGFALYLAAAVGCGAAMHKLGIWTAARGMSLTWGWLTTAAIPVIGAGVLMTVLPGFGIAVNALINDLALTYASCASVVAAVMWPWAEHGQVSEMHRKIGSLTLTSSSTGNPFDVEVRAAQSEAAAPAQQPATPKEAASVTTASQATASKSKAARGNPEIAKAAQAACGHVDGPAAAGFQAG